ncbi:DUF4880 domain-containing protein [Pseudomonas sp. MAFF212428]|uniref:DUF4880 domain-containing protein n=1 Tax=Pseudomonas brassicae TaxID=2708063 RepID=A0A6M0CNU7_9PSED|nr:DUF4880 domain-containing protein [Pseudomonas brassicae]
MNPMATLDPLQRAALEQAALWRARLNADAVGDADRQAWQTWHDAHEQHRWAWQQVAQVQQRLGQLPAGLAGRALDLTTQRGSGGAPWGAQGACCCWPAPQALAGQATVKSGTRRGPPTTTRGSASVRR